jgi:hypothetical protein
MVRLSVNIERVYYAFGEYARGGIGSSNFTFSLSQRHRVTVKFHHEGAEGAQRDFE